MDRGSWLGWMATAFIVAAGCAGTNGAPPTTVIAKESTSATGDPNPTPPRSERPDEISEDGVGDVRLGQPLPERLLKSDLAARYRMRFIADAQPFHGFELESPPLYVRLEDDPMEQDDPIPESEEDEERLRAKYGPLAHAHARGGAKVSTILISKPELKTRSGLGVGTSHGELEALIGSFSITRSPESLEAKPTCSVEPKQPLGLRLWLASCAPGAEPGPVKWIWVVGRP